MKIHGATLIPLLAVLVLPRSLYAAPQLATEPQRLVITGRDYRVTVGRYRGELRLEVHDAAGRWRAITSKRESQAEFAVVDTAGVHSGLGGPVRLRQARIGDAIVLGLTSVLPAVAPTIASADFVCADEGLLIRFSPRSNSHGKTACWAVPRMALDDKLIDAYAYWRAADALRCGPIAALGAPSGYAGVSAWGNQGDTARRLSARHPAIIARSESAGLALGVVFLDYETRWAQAHSFLQRQAPNFLYFYPAIVDGEVAGRGSWAWLAPLPVDAAAAGRQVERLLETGTRLTAGFRSIAAEPDESWSRALPDFPAALRHARPVDDVREAVVYTMNEMIFSDDGMALARKTGSDVLIRGWFKWNNAPDFAKLAPLVPQAHAMGALMGGGITCSALYHGENGLTEGQVLDMATRGPAGQLVDAWKTPHCRHGTLSNPVYLEYLLSWCKREIDAGADYLFMDEINAALQSDEGFDDYSIADFRQFLLRQFGKQGWTPDDARWRKSFKVDLNDRNVASDATMDTFQYRAYLQSLGLATKPYAADNPLASQWQAFRDERDDRAWKWLTDAIHAHAAAKGRRVLVSGNGLARYVDLQVLGVWDKWQTAAGRIDLSENQIEEWGSTVAAGWGLAGKRVPVVFFHDWGFGGFPWMEVSPEDRQLWIRVRGAEIYAAGGFFAFPVHGPLGNDARQDGTLAEIARQSAFYHQHKAIYLGARLVGFEPLESDQPGLSLALWRCQSPPSLMLHVINRHAEDGKLRRRKPVNVRIPVAQRPKAVRVVSPDWAGEKTGETVVRDGRLTVSIPEVEAYSVAILDYDCLPEVALAGRRIVPSRQWARPAQNEFIVQKGGLVRDPWALPGMLQGNLHKDLRNPPTFVVNMPRGGALRVHVRAVAIPGARLQWQVDGQIVKTIDLPDRDGKNDSQAREYDQTYDLSIPPGRHRLTLDNRGGDWASIGWYAVAGETQDP
jgi:hypothetical protein